MALKTQGFALSALPKAPQIPNNIGQIDVKEIYDGVRRGLESFEMARTALPRMALADAEIAAKTAQAPLTTRGVLAQTEAAEQQLPLRTALLAAEASPEMQEAKRQALLNRSIKQPAGAVQTAQALANARLRLQEDSTDLAAIELVKALERIAPNVQGAIDQRATAVTDNNATKIAVAATADETKREIAGATLDSVEQRAAAANAMREDLAKRGFTQSEINARIAAESRVNAAKAAFTGKIYETAAEKNDKLNQDLAAVDLLDRKVDAYKNSFLGAGPIAGSGLATTVRAVFGDTTGKELAAAAAISMGGAIEKMRGLGAMSENEYKAAIAELPQTNDPASVLDTKMDFIKSIRRWAAARNSLFLQRLEAGDSPLQAHKAVRLAIPLMLPNGKIADPEVVVSVTTPPSAAPAASAVRAFANEAEAQAAADRNEIRAGDQITVGGTPGRWQ